MALARNINRNKLKRKIKIPEIAKKTRIFVIFGAIIILTFGALSLLPHFRLGQAQKNEIKLQTGDRPLPQVIPIWVTADGGLRMRSKPDPKSGIVYLVPNGTKLNATELQNGWYRVSYMNKDGWVDKNYVTTEAPAEDPTKKWKTFTSATLGYTIRYPDGWVYQDYGSNPATGSTNYVAFGSQLPAVLNPSILPPVIIRATSQVLSQVEAGYKSKQSSVAEAVTVSGLPASKIIFESESGTQMVSFVVQKGSLVYVIEETGGYSDELTKMVSALNLP